MMPEGHDVKEHPHVRGEDVLPRGYAARIDGAPPRAWGGRILVSDDVARGWSTPTCVGRTGGRPGHRQLQAEHPHVRGEDEPGGLFHADPSGAPPRAWGGRGDRVDAVDIRRSTPTCVGRTLSDLRFYQPSGQMVSAGVGASSWCSWGLIATRVRPSKSTGRRLRAPAVRREKPCSVSSGWMRTAAPSPTTLLAAFHSSSRTLAESVPTNMPGVTSIIQRLSAPRRRSGTAVVARTTREATSVPGV